MKIYKYILGAVLLSGLTLPLTNVRAQDVHLKCLEWNVKALEFYNNSNVSREIDRFVALIQEQQAEIIFFNEFETLSGAMFLKEKANEFAKELGMYSFFIHSYNKRGDDGYYGNVILSKYPIVNTGRVLLGMYEGADQRSVGWADILVPTDSKPEGVKVRIVCTHLDAFGGDVTCFEQAREVLEHAVKPSVDQGIPVLLAGDMNCGYYSTAIAEYEKSGDRLCNNNGTFSHGGSKLDYLIGFPKQKWTCTDYQVIRTAEADALSDHSPITGTAVLKN